MKKVIAFFFALFLVLTFIGCSEQPRYYHDTYPSSSETMPSTAAALPQEMPDDFSFALTWNCFGVSSYDSKTGKLVKTTDATHPEDYITYYNLPEEYKIRIYEWILDLDVNAYPDVYNPHKDGYTSSPPMTLILTVRVGDLEKTIKAEDIAIDYESENPKGQKFLTTCKSIHEFLTETEEWESLPDYEFYYD